MLQSLPKPDSVAPVEPLSIAQRLAVLVIAVMVAILLLAVFLIQYSARANRETVTEQMLSSARAMMMAVNSQLMNKQGILIVLSGAKQLEDHDWPGFYERAKSVIAQETENLGDRISLIDPSGRQIVNTLVPYGTPLPDAGGLDAVREVVATGRPVTSDLFTGAITKAHTVGVYVPVFERGRVAYVLVLAFAPQQIKIVSSQNLPPGAIAAVTDRRGLIIARTFHPENFIGKLLVPELHARTMSSDEGTVDVRTYEGVLVHDVYTKSLITGWHVVLGLEQSVIDAAMWGSLKIAGVGGFLIITAALLLAAYLARSIARPITALSAMAAAMG